MSFVAYFVLVLVFVAGFIEVAPKTSKNGIGVTPEPSKDKMGNLVEWLVSSAPHIINATKTNGTLSNLLSQIAQPLENNNNNNNNKRPVKKPISSDGPQSMETGESGTSWQNNLFNTVASQSFLSQAGNENANNLSGGINWVLEKISSLPGVIGAIITVIIVILLTLGFSMGFISQLFSHCPTVF